MSPVYLFSIALLSGLVFVISSFCSLWVYFVLFLVPDVGANVTDLRLFSLPVFASPALGPAPHERGRAVERSLGLALGGTAAACWPRWPNQSSQHSTRVPCTSCQPPQPPCGAGGRQAPWTRGETNQPSNQPHGLNTYVQLPKEKAKPPFLFHICPGI